MTQLMQAFDATLYDPTQGGGGGFPIGKHPVVINGSEIKSTKDNTGGYLQLNLEVIDGPHKGLTGAYRLNLYNQSQEAVGIAHKQMSALCHVIQTYKVDNVQVMYGKPFIIEVGPQKNDPQYTEIKKVYDINGNEPGKTGAAPAQPAAPAAPAAGGWQAPAAPAAAPAAAAPAWGGQPAAAAPAAAPAWGGAPAAAAPAAPAPAAGGWQGAPAAGGNAPWGAK